MSKRLLFLFLILFSSSCIYSKPINFGIAQSPQNLDPRLSRDAASEKIIDLIYEKIFEIDENFQLVSKYIEPRMINPSTYILKRNNVTGFFENKSSITIEDIFFTIKDNQENSVSKFNNDLRAIKSIQVVGNEIYIELHRPDPNFLFRLRIPILPKNLNELHVNFTKESIGSNLFKIKTIKPYLILERNDGVEIKFIEVKDPSVRALKLVTNEIDMLQNDIPLPILQYLKNQKEVHTESNKGNNISYIGFNHKSKFTKNKLIRKAIAHGINRNEIIHYFFNEKTELANQLLTSNHWSYVQINDNQFNPELSKKLLQEAGVDLPITIEFKTSTDSFRIKIATILKNQLEKIGINLKIISLDWGTFYSDIQRGNFEMYSLTWVNLTSPEIYKDIFHSKMIPPQGLNRSYYEDINLDKMIESSEKNNNWNDVVQFIFNEALMIPLWYEGNFFASNRSLRNYQLKKNGSWSSLNFVKKINDKD